MFAIDGVDDNNRPIHGVTSNTELANDEVSVILVRFHEERARRIFNKINRYAKPTSKADNLITDDDDAIAVMSRELLRSEDGVIPAHLVRIGANTLNKTAPEFTTLATFYEANVHIVMDLGITGKGHPKSMTADQRDLVKEQVQSIWTKLLFGVDLWRKALEDTSAGGDSIRRQIREETLLGKPIGQLSLVYAFMHMLGKCPDASDDELCGRINRIDWDVNNTMWHGVLMNPNGRVMSGKATVNLAAGFIAHLGGAELSDDERAQLLERIHGADWQSHKLPEPVQQDNILG